MDILEVENQQITQLKNNKEFQKLKKDYEDLL